jgi:hypothetical protein
MRRAIPRSSRRRHRRCRDNAEEVCVASSNAGGSVASVDESDCKNGRLQRAWGHFQNDHSLVMRVAVRRLCPVLPMLSLSQQFRQKLAGVRCLARRYFLGSATGGNQNARGKQWRNGWVTLRRYPMAASRQKFRPTPEEFIEAWQSSSTVREVARKLRMKTNQVRVRACRYRQRGVPLKDYAP